MTYSSILVECLFQLLFKKSKWETEFLRPWMFSYMLNLLLCKDANNKGQKWYGPKRSSKYQESSVQFSRSVMSNSLQPHEPQHARPSCPSPTPGVHPNPYPLSQWCHPTISSSAMSPSPVFNLSQHQGLFKWVTFSHQVAKVFEFQLQHQSFQWTPRADLP